MKKIKLFIFILGIFNSQLLFAQQKITGVVKDDVGPIPGVTILEKGVNNYGTVTDVKGQYTLILRGTSKTLIVKNIGYATVEVKVTGPNMAPITLKSSSQDLDEVVVQGFVPRTKLTNTGAVSTIQAAVIRNIPTSSVQNTLQGRLPGFFSQQRSGQPGKDASDFYIRGVSSLNAEGNRPLIIVDDIEYTYEQLSQINVNEIESISILKDASTTAIYGIKGANGVLVVKTRRGVVGAPKVNVRVETGIQAPVNTPKFLDAYNTAILRNEALSNDNIPPDFTNADLLAFKNGTDKYLHPNVNWYDVVFKPRSSQSNANIDISGGTQNVKYFIAGGYFTQDGAVRDFSTSRSEVNSNFFYKRFTYRTNLDVRATPTTNFRIDLTGRFGDINSPRANSGLLGEIYDYNSISPYAAPVLNPNGSYSYNPKSIGNINLPTINSRLATQGYNRERNNDFNVLLDVLQNLEAVTEGLTFNGRVAYASTTRIDRGLQRLDAPPTFRYNETPSGEGYYTVRPGGGYVLSRFGLFGGIGSNYKSVNLQSFFNYNRTFGKHNVNSLLLFNQNTTQDRADLPTNYRGYSFKVGYGYDNRYLIDFNSAYNGTDRFSSHYGYFPAVSVAWNISKEKFFNFPSVDLFKLRGSYGVVGSDAVSGNKYLYLQEYIGGGSYAFGQTAPISTSGFREGDLGNEFVSWEKQRELNVGVELNMWNGKFALVFDYFSNFRYNQLIARNSVPQILGVGLPRDNLGEVQNRGFDGSVSYRPTIGNVKLDFTFVFSYSKNKILYFDEAQPDFKYLQRTGTSLNQPFGYTWIGYYKDDADVAASPKPVGTVPVQPGDLKYLDRSGDGVIDAKDQSAIGKPNLPNLTLGLPINVSYKGFSANILFQGSFNYSLILGTQSIVPFQSQLQNIHLERWTPQTANTAQFPRLSTLRATVNDPSAYPSNFWLIDAQYIRLKTVELGYQLPTKYLPLRINNARVYFSAYNLFTWTNYSLYQQDPEVANLAGDSYLNQRVFNLGLQVGF